MSALADYRLLWTAAFDQWRRRTFIVLVKVLAVLVFLIGVGVGVARHDWMIGMRIGLGIPMLLLLLMWTMVVMPGLALMNTPANARLVPRMRKRMVEMTAACWLLAAVFSLATPFWQSTPLIVLWVMSMSGARGGDRMATGFIIFSAMSGVVLDSLPAPVREFCMSAPGVFIFCGLVAAYGAWSIRTVLPNGGDKHFARRKRQVELIERFRSMGRKPGSAERKQTTVSPYGFVLRRAINARHSSSLMLLGLGPGPHWTNMLPLCAMILIGGFGLHLLFGVRGSADSSISGWILLLIFIVIVQVACFSGSKSFIAAGRKEANLLRLAPAWPDARKWNRSFAAVLVRNALAVCMLTILTTVVLALLDGANEFELISLTALSTTLVMPGLAWMLHDYSREQDKPTLWGLPVALLLLPGLVAMLGLQIKIGAMAWVLLAAVSNVIGALAAVWGWKKMIAAPAAFAA